MTREGTRKDSAYQDRSQHLEELVVIEVVCQAKGLARADKPD